jgi:hypothetical protein
LNSLVGTYTADIVVTQGSGDPEGRAEGGPVFAGKLYEVAEEGMSELLRMGGRTYLIPGMDGHVVPLQTMAGGLSGGDTSSGIRESDPMDSVVGLLTSMEHQFGTFIELLTEPEPTYVGGDRAPSNFQIPAAPQQNGGGNVYVSIENGDTNVTIDGTDLDPEQLETAIVNSLSEFEEARNNAWRQEMRASGRA